MIEGLVTVKVLNIELFFFNLGVLRKISQRNTAMDERLRNFAIMLKNGYQELTVAGSEKIAAWRLEKDMTVAGTSSDNMDKVVELDGKLYLRLPEVYST